MTLELLDEINNVKEEMQKVEAELRTITIFNCKSLFLQDYEGREIRIDDIMPDIVTVVEALKRKKLDDLEKKFKLM